MEVITAEHSNKAAIMSSPPPPHPPSLSRYSQDAAPEADGRAHFTVGVAETTGSL